MLNYKDTQVGLELEYEGIAPNVSRSLLVKHGGDDAGLWHCDADGSLRPRDRNTEFKFAIPLAGAVAERAIHLVGKVVGGAGYIPSWRCGMHVHVDNRDAPPWSAEKQAILACMLDRLWFGWDNTGRQESKFCVPISQVWQHMLPPGARGRPVRRPWEDALPEIDAGPRLRRRAPVQQAVFRTYKYTGLNIRRAIPQDINTVEYRYPSCTKDVDRMFEFINMAVWCQKFANRFPTGTDLVLTFVQAGTFDAWIRRYVPKELQASWQSGRANMQGPQHLTPLELEAAASLAAIVV